MSEPAPRVESVAHPAGLAGLRGIGPLHDGRLEQAKALGALLQLGTSSSGGCGLGFHATRTLSEESASADHVEAVARAEAVDHPR